MQSCQGPQSASARRLIAATALTAGALVSVVTLPASAADHARPERPKVKISDVQYDSPGRDGRSNRSLNREWVEISNTGRRSVNLDGWTLQDEDGRTYTFDDYRLEGRATVRINTGHGRDTDSDLYQDRRCAAWKASGHDVVLARVDAHCGRGQPCPPGTRRNRSYGQGLLLSVVQCYGPRRERRTSSSSQHCRPPSRAARSLRGRRTARMASHDDRVPGARRWC
ncbi:lamin tail domain-containing protein [Streptomyces tibetensis]|uniref:lamin tail domain-containing protein n=1 Tax=Streptomyces tibetensis TaxID=2382123 RepID=UPI0033CA2016